jgi:hypothetical protein
LETNENQQVSGRRARLPLLSVELAIAAVLEQVRRPDGAKTPQIRKSHGYGRN